MTKDRMPLCVMIVILVGCMIAGSFFYSLFAMYFSSKKKESSGTNQKVDYYNINLQNDLGIAADKYYEREVYSDEQFEEDKKNVIRYLDADRYDIISELATKCLSEYQFTDSKVATISALAIAGEVFSEDSKSLTDQRILMVSSIADMELFVRFFLRLTSSEQITMAGEMIEGWPGFDYEFIEIGRVDSVGPDVISEYDNFQNTSVYRAVLEYCGRKYYLYLSNEGHIRILGFEVSHPYGGQQ